jgi:hypothetical protein
MKQTTINIHIFACHCTWAENELAYYVTTEDAATPTCPVGYILAYSGKVTFDLPTRAVAVNAAVTRLRKDQSSLRAKAESEAVKIEEQIRNLLALTHDTPAEGPANVT